ncbi:hypothetical protein M758_1G200700 [Ceratodon purpureus]|nr:hypothetical protein M758_1G200700 [Ceratodon purpureus]
MCTVYPSAPSISPQPEPKTSSQPKRSFTSSMRLRPNLVQDRIGWCQGWYRQDLHQTQIFNVQHNII